MYIPALRSWFPGVYLCLHMAQYLAEAKPQILIYSRTAAFRHDSIPFAINVLQTKQDMIDVQFIASEDPSQFRDEILSTFDAVVFLSTTGEVLDAAGKIAFQNYLNQGGNFVGIHSASDTLLNTTSYTRELGSVFDYHANLQTFVVEVVGPEHPSTSGLDARWEIQDEVYNFKSDPRSLGAVVILSADDSTVVDPNTRRFDQGTPHPSAWYQDRGAGVEPGGVAGRSFYTSLGHLNETWETEAFISHILGGISWVLEGNTTKAFNASALVGNAGSSNTTYRTLTGGNPKSTDPMSNSPGTSSTSSTLKSRNSGLEVFGCILTGAIGLFL